MRKPLENQYFQVADFTLSHKPDSTSTFLRELVATGIGT